MHLLAFNWLYKRVQEYLKKIVTRTLREGTGRFVSSGAHFAYDEGSQGLARQKSN